eukprot:2349187-Rhodomonas_salina.1
MRSPVLSGCKVLWAYARAMRCPVLSGCMAVPAHTGAERGVRDLHAVLQGSVRPYAYLHTVLLALSYVYLHTRDSYILCHVYLRTDGVLRPTRICILKPVLTRAYSATSS